MYHSNKNVQQLNVNIVEMKKKTEIENNLLMKINTDLEECYNDLGFIYKNYTMREQNCENITFTLYSIDKIFEKKSELSELELSKLKKNLVEKLFNKVNTIYHVFKYFYDKKKDFMGMNLTGLVQGKMETGLSFRNTMEKISSQNILKKYPEVSTLINLSDLSDSSDSSDLSNLNLNLSSSIIMYRIKTESFEWNDFGLEKYSNLFVISNLNTKEYFLLFEK